MQSDQRNEVFWDFVTLRKSTRVTLMLQLSPYTGDSGSWESPISSRNMRRPGRTFISKQTKTNEQTNKHLTRPLS